MKARSMRDNLIFTKIPEVDNETNEQTERSLRRFNTEKLNLNQERVKLIEFERVHGIWVIKGSARAI